MRVRYLFGTLLGLLMVPTFVMAQNYHQDFSATFFPPTGTPGKVSVSLTNESGQTVTPFNNVEVADLKSAYAGRPLFAGRTGGANANEEVGPVTSVYKNGAVSTPVTYPVSPLPSVYTSGAYTPDTNLDSAFITLNEEGVNSSSTAVAWDEAYTGAYTQVTHTFQFRLSSGNPTANDKADGIGFAFLNDANYGTTGAFASSEEPNFNNSVGVGFDIWDNGGEGGNSISLHYNGQLLQNMPIDDGTTDPNGQPWAFNAFETGERPKERIR